MKKLLPLLLIAVSMISAFAQPVLPRESDTLDFITLTGATNRFVWTGTNFYSSTIQGKIYRTNTAAYAYAQANILMFTNALSFASTWYSNSAGGIAGTSRWYGVTSPSSPSAPSTTSGIMNLNANGVLTGPSTNFFSTNDVAMRAAFDAPFTLVYMGDIHSGYSHSPGALQDVATMGRDWFSNSITYIVAQTTNLNIRMFISAGDIVDGSTNSEEYPWVTNQLQRLRTAGLSLFLSGGNHEQASLPDIYWEQYIRPMILSDPAFTGTTNIQAGTKEIVMAQTNSGIPMVFISSDIFATNRTGWLQAQASNYPNHYVIAATHINLSSHGTLSTESDGGYDWNIIRKIPNLRLIFSGHNRDAFNWASRSDLLDSGNAVQSLFFNTQQNTNTGGNYIRFYTFYPRFNSVAARTYDSYNGHFLSNGEPAIATSYTSNGYFANFSFPIQDQFNTPQSLRLKGIPSLQKSFGQGIGNWSRSLASNSVLDTSITMDAFNSDGSYNNSWTIGRDFGSNSIKFIYSDSNVKGDPSSGTNILELGPSGFVKVPQVSDALRAMILNTSDPSNTNTIFTTVAGTANASEKLMTNGFNGSWTTVGGLGYITNISGLYTIIVAAIARYTNSTLYGQYTATASGAAPAPYVGPIQGTVGSITNHVIINTSLGAALKHYWSDGSNFFNSTVP